MSAQTQCILGDPLCQGPQPGWPTSPKRSGEDRVPEEGTPTNPRERDRGCEVSERRQPLHSNVLAQAWDHCRPAAAVLGAFSDGLKEHIESKIKRESSFLIEKRGGKAVASRLFLGVPQAGRRAGTVDCDFLVCHCVPSTWHSA